MTHCAMWYTVVIYAESLLTDSASLSSDSRCRCVYLCFQNSCELYFVCQKACMCWCILFLMLTQHHLSFCVKWNSCVVLSSWACWYSCLHSLGFFVYLCYYFCDKSLPYAAAYCSFCEPNSQRLCKRSCCQNLYQS